MTRSLLVEEKNSQCIGDAHKILCALIHEYPSVDEESSYMIYNILCASMVIFIKERTDKKDYKKMVKTTTRILNDNLK